MAFSGVFAEFRRLHTYGKPSLREAICHRYIELNLALSRSVHLLHQAQSLSKSMRSSPWRMCVAQAVGLQAVVPGLFTLSCTGATRLGSRDSLFYVTLDVCSVVGACFRLFLWRAARV